MSKYYEKHRNVRTLNLLMGPALFLLCLVMLPHSVFTTAASRGAVGTVVWMAYWWVSGPIDFAITGFLPIAVNAFLQMADMAAVIANYADEIVLLLLGASILTAVWEMTGKEYIYMHWVVRFLPLMIVLVVVNILYLLFFCGKDETLGGSREYFEMQYRAMGKMKPGEKWGFGLFAAAAVLSFSRQLYQNLLPNLKPAYVFLICAIMPLSSPRATAAV